MKKSLGAPRPAGCRPHGHHPVDVKAAKPPDRPAMRPGRATLRPRAADNSIDGFQGALERRQGRFWASFGPLKPFRRNFRPDRAGNTPRGPKPCRKSGRKGAEPSRTEPNRAEPSRTSPSRARPRPNRQSRLSRRRRQTPTGPCGYLPGPRGFHPLRVWHCAWIWPRFGERLPHRMRRCARYPGGPRWAKT